MSLLAGQAHQRRYPYYRYQPVIKRKRLDESKLDSDECTTSSDENSRKSYTDKQEHNHCARAQDPNDLNESHSMKRLRAEQANADTPILYFQEQVKINEFFSPQILLSEPAFASYAYLENDDSLERFETTAAAEFFDGFSAFKGSVLSEEITDLWEIQPNVTFWSDLLHDTERRAKILQSTCPGEYVE